MKPIKKIHISFFIFHFSFFTFHFSLTCHMIPHPLLFRHDARCNVHGLQFLKQQLARIWNFHIRKLGAVLAHVTAVNTHFVIHGSNHAAPLAHVHLVLVRRIVHAPARESARPVRHHAVALHFTKPVPTISAAPLRRQ